MRTEEEILAAPHKIPPKGAGYDYSGGLKSDEHGNVYRQVGTFRVYYGRKRQPEEHDV